MIINHNIAALNTYRQLSNNNVMSNKSLEKLSSGLRINRAGDDAAGLAISEKMRAQIRGLDQAVRNSQDGISMIQTAEGALNETHSILQRMRELADQAANDTNVKIDRDEIQKEINQLTSEINRIGNTTEFNTQKLLNGGGEETKLSVNTLIAGAGTGKIAGVDTGSFNIAELAKSVKGEAAVWQGDITKATAAGTGTIVFQGVTLTVTTVTTGTASNSGITANAGTLTIGIDQSADDFAGAIASAFDAIKQFGGEDSALKDFTFENTTGATLKVTAQTLGDQYNSDGFKVNAGTATALAISAGGTAPTTPGADEVRGEYAFTIDKAFEAVGTKLTIDGETFTAVASDAAGNQFNVGIDAKEQALSLAMAINSNSTLSAKYDALVDGAKITLREKEGKAAGGTGIGDGALADNTAVQGKYSFSVNDLVAVGGKYEIDGVKIEVTDDKTNAGLSNGTAVLYDSTKNGQAALLKKAIEANSELNSKYSAEVSNTTITLTQKATKQSMVATEAKTNTNAKDGFEANFQVGANSGQSMTIEVNDMRSLALGVSGKEANTKATARNGVEASYVAVTNVTNGTDNTNVEYALDVSDHKKATAAISVINDAIETVSAERSKLGAYQNRLEHTINNLGTSSENLSAAESRIRDVDMAKEIMEFTKMNILSQAAQAMLEVLAA